jgi:flagellar biosynthesis GTPase FlhF
MKDPKTEQYLTHGQWAWDYHERVPVAEIDMAASETNPARLHRRLDDDRAIQYGMEMKAGVEFPAIVLLNLTDSPGFKYLVATGMHRLKGAWATDKTWFDAYVVTEADIYRRDYLTRHLNAIEGRGMTMAEQITQALALHEAYPSKSLGLIAKEWNLKLSTLQVEMAAKRSRLRARKYGFDLDRAKVPQKAAVALGSIHSDVVFEKAAEFVATTGGVQNSEVRDMAAEIKKARDEKSQLAIVDKYREAAEEKTRRAKAKHGRIRPAAANRVIADARRLNNQIDKPLVDMHVAALENRPDALILIDDLIDNLKRFRAELERAERMSVPLSPGAAAELRV